MERDILLSVLRDLLSDISFIVNISPMSPIIVDLYFARLFVSKNIGDPRIHLDPNSEVGKSLFQGYIEAYFSIDIRSLCKEYGYEFQFSNHLAIAVHNSNYLK